jgi:hypothetical protein
MNKAAFLIALALPLGAAADEACGKNHFILDYPCQVDVLRNWRWSPAGQLQVPNWSPNATLLADGRILVTGGTTAVEIYDPASKLSRMTAPMSIARQVPEAIRLLDGRVLVTGAANVPYTAESLGLNGIVEIFDPVTERWSLAAPMLTPRVAHSMTLLADGRVLAAGGVDDRDGTLASAEIYDPATDTWRFTAPMNEGRLTHTATRLRDGTVLVTGGRTDDFWEVVTPSTEIFDPATEAWTALAPLSSSRDWHTATLLPDGDVLVVGGYAKGKEWEPLSFAHVDRLGPAGWRAEAPLTLRRMGHAASLVAGGLVLVTGGLDWQSRWVGSLGNTGRVEAYNPSTGAWQLVADMSIARTMHAAVTLPDGRVVVIGGQSSGHADDPAMRSIEIFGPSADAALGVARRSR